MNFFIIRLKFFGLRYGLMFAWRHGDSFHTTYVPARFPTTLREKLKIARDLRSTFIKDLFEKQGLVIPSRSKPQDLLTLVSDK